MSKRVSTGEPPPGPPTAAAASVGAVDASVGAHLAPATVKREPAPGSRVATAASALPIDPNATVLVNAFNAVDLVQLALRRKQPKVGGGGSSALVDRQPSTLSSIERRWFAGRQTLETAKEKAKAMVQPGQPRSKARERELVGTAALLQLARQKHPLVSLAPSAGPEGGEFQELTVRVQSKKPGRAKKGEAPTERIIAARCADCEATRCVLCSATLRLDFLIRAVRFQGLLYPLLCGGGLSALRRRVEGHARGRGSQSTGQGSSAGRGRHRQQSGKSGGPHW
jgi:hypothetical protein